MRKFITSLFMLSLIATSFSVTTGSKADSAKAEPNFPSIGEEYLGNTDFSQELIPFENVENFTEGNFVNLMAERTLNPQECLSPGGAVKIQYDSADSHLNINDYPAIWQDVYVKPNTYYLWSAHIKRLGSARNGYFSIGYRNPLAADKWIAVNQNLLNDTTHEWEEISILINTGSLNAIRASMHVKCESTGQDGWYLIDDVSLKEIDPNNYIDTSCSAPTGVKFADFSKQYVNDPGFERLGTSDNTNTLLPTLTWKSFSWGGTDRNGWGYEGSTANVFLTFQNDGLPAGERPAIGQDLLLKQNTYYVVSFYAKRWENTAKESKITVAFQDTDGVNSGTDNNTAMFKKNLDSHTFDGASTSWSEFVCVLYTGEYAKNRLVIFTEAIDYDGSSPNGYHIDNVRVWEAKEPEEAKLNVSAGYVIGKEVKHTIKVKFKGENEFVDVPFSKHNKTYFEFSNPGVFVGDLNNRLIAKTKGESTVGATLKIFGKEIKTNSINLKVNDSNANENTYLETLDLSTNQEISTTQYVTLQIFGMDSALNFVDYSQMKLTVISDSPEVVYVRLLTTGYHVIGLSKGSSTVYVTAEYQGSIAISTITFDIDTDNYLIDGGFEAQNEYSFWKFKGNSGGSGDDSQTNVYRRSGYANIWMMAPIFWDANVPSAADVSLSQTVSLPIGKYALSVYISRYFATGVDGQLSTKGGMATLSATPIDNEGNRLEPIYREFDTSYGANEYGKLSLVFDVTNASKYEIALTVKGDSQYGLGMQVDDFELTAATYPIGIEANLGEDITNVEVDILYQIFVYAVYGNGSKEQITTDLRFFFDDFSIACVSNGFLIPRKAGTTTCTVRAQILDQVYTTTFEVVVEGGVAPKPATNTDNTGLIIGLSVGGGVLVLAAAMIAVININKKRKEKGRE